MQECSLAKRIQILSPPKTSSVVVERLFSVFVDLRRKTHVESAGRKEYPMIIRDDDSRYIWICFIFHKFDAADVFARFLSDLNKKEFLLR